MLKTPMRFIYYLDGLKVMKYILTLVSIDNGSPGYSIINFNLLIRSFFFLHNRETTASYALGFIYISRKSWVLFPLLLCSLLSILYNYIIYSSIHAFHLKHFSRLMPGSQQIFIFKWNCRLWNTIFHCCRLVLIRVSKWYVVNTT